MHNGAAEKASASPTGAISFAQRLSFSRASRFIRNFIWEYFLKTCASLWRSSCVMLSLRAGLEESTAGLCFRLPCSRSCSPEFHSAPSANRSIPRRS